MVKKRRFISFDFETSEPPSKRRQVQRDSSYYEMVQQMMDTLPAAQFFWYHLVPASKKREYITSLGKLVLLFTQPHYYNSPFTLEPMYPYKEGSFLKKFEEFISIPDMLEWFTEQLYSVLAFNRDSVFTPTSFFTLSSERSTFSYGDKMNFREAVEQWYLHNPAKTLFVTLLNIVAPSMGHAVLFVAKRSHEGMTYYCLDSHGYRTDDERLQLYDVVIPDTLKLALPPSKTVKKLMIRCPVLQNFGQGGNCGQWFAMMLSFIVLDPTLFEETKLNQFLRVIEPYANLNILLFTLSMFLRAVPNGTVNMLKNIAFVDFLQSKLTSAPYSALHQLSLKLDKRHRYSFYNSTNLTDCNALDDVLPENAQDDRCQAPCTRCGTRCVNANFVTVQRGHCIPFTVRDIAEKMFTIYFKLRVRVLQNMTPEEAQMLGDKVTQQLDKIVTPSLEVFATYLENNELEELTQNRERYGL